MKEVIVWAGWFGGIGIAVYAGLQHLLTSKHLGCSSSYIGMCRRVDKRAFDGDYNDGNEFWRLWFILGIPLGGFIALITSPNPDLSITWSMGQYYDALYPESFWLKGAIVLFGGVLMGMGARLAGGCTSGHVITGIALRSPASLISAVLFFAGGLITVQGLVFLAGGLPL